MNSMRGPSARILLLVVSVVLVFTLTMQDSNSFPAQSNSSSPIQKSSLGTFVPSHLIVRAANAQVAPAAKSFVMMITSKGFDDNASVVVNQGDKVSITFIMDQSQRSNTLPSNHHVIAIDGYNVVTADINPTHPNATVTFTASQLGTFSVYCDSPECPVHALMVSGTLEVDKPGPSQSSTTRTVPGTSTTATSLTTSSQAAIQTTSTPTGGGSSTAASATQSQTTQAQAQTVTVTQTNQGSGGIDFNSLGTFLLVILAVSFLVGTLVSWRFIVPPVKRPT